MHLILDGVTTHWLTREGAEIAFNKLIDLLEMEPLGELHFVDSRIGPSFVRFILQPVRESHIAVNYIRDKIAVDVFSCKDFAPDKVEAFCVEEFCIVKILNRILLYRVFDI